MSEAPDQKIHLMDDVLASQVAAGEVVERPASVLKELVENSIDAGAHYVRVEVRRGGVALMKVTDDGSGMSRADAELCLMRHATSKLRDVEGLFDIRQLGFRGEALPSIASVAQLQIQTRRASDVGGTMIRSEGGSKPQVLDAGCAPGTEITVTNLFYNTPVRRKFLKSDETEYGHVEHQLRLHALAFPEVRFVLVKDGTTCFDVAATHDLRYRIAEFIGREQAAKLMRIRPTEAPGVRVTGFLMPLTEARRNRRMQYIFLNGRPIEDKIIARAVRDGFGGFPTGLHPSLFLYLEVDPGLVDVNVHPAKREVRFRRPSDVTMAVMEAIGSTLAAHARGEMEAAPSATGTARTPSSPTSSSVPVSATTEPSKKAAPPLGSGSGTGFVLRPIAELRQQQLKLQPRNDAPPSPGGLTASSQVQAQHPLPGFPPSATASSPSRSTTCGSPSSPGSSAAPSASTTSVSSTASGTSSASGSRATPSHPANDSPATPSSAPAPYTYTGTATDSAPVASPGTTSVGPEELLPKFRYLGCLHQKYALFENSEGLVLMNPRAARERIIFERLLETNRRPLTSQRLLTPLMLEWDVRDMGAVLHLLPQCEQAGFIITPFGRSTLRVEALPALLPLDEVEPFLYDLMNFFVRGEGRVRRSRNPFEPFAIRLAHQYACAENIGSWLERPLPLLIDLLRCEIPYCTPTGKPTLVPFALSEINRKFQSQ